MKTSRKMEIGTGIASLGFDAYTILDPSIAKSVISHIYNYLQIPDGASPLGVDYKTLTLVTFVGVSVAGGLYALLKSEKE